MIREPTLYEISGLEHVPLSLLDPDDPMLYAEIAEIMRGVYDGDGNMIALFGAYRAWPGVACVFTALDQTAIHGNWTRLVRAGRECIEIAHNELGVHRLQTYVPLDKQTMRFNDMIGMRAESVMEGATPDRRPVIVYRHLRGVETWARQ